MRKVPVVAVVGATLALLVLLAPGARAAEEARLTRRPLARKDAVSCCPRLAVEGYWRIGPAEGWLQTPRGGKPGTTSRERPGLDEIGVDTMTELGIAATTTWLRHEIAFEWNVALLSGEAVLLKDLVSQEQLFPTGTTLDSSSWLGTYRLGYRYRFDVPFGGRERLVVRPGVGLTGLDVNVAIDGSNFRKVDRSYLHGAPHVDLALSWRPCGFSRLVFEGTVSQTLYPLMGENNQMDVLEARLLLRYEASPCAHLRFETGWRRTDWQDEQTVPNHIRVEYGPWFGFGLGLRF